MWLAVVLFCLILALFAYLDAKKPKNYPPGPEWYPIIGCMLLVQRLRKETGYLYQACEELSRRYGPVVGLKIGKDKQIVCSGYEAVKELLTKEEFDGRPSGPFYEDRTWGSRRGLLLVDEQFWVEQKRFVLRHLREFGFGKRTMSELVEQESLQLLTTFKEAIDKEGGRSAVMPMRDAFSVSVLNTLWSMLAGIRYSPEDKELKHLQGLLTELFANIDMVGTIFSQFPFLRWLAPEKSGYKQFIDIHQNVWKFLKTELDNHKATFRADDPRDLMDVYLEMLHSKDRSASFSESQLLAICMDMFMAGSETTSKSMGFGFLYLLYHPEVQVRAQEELDRVVGRNRLPTLNDRPEMPYMESIVLESVRMFMGRTFSIPHRALRDATIQGYHVPKGTMLIANFHHCLMSPDLWDEPELFKPERFINSENKVVIPDNYLPFGFGKHRCMGQALARSNIFLFTATLLQNFNFSFVPGQELPSKLGVDGVTPSPGEFDALVTVRD